MKEETAIKFARFRAEKRVNGLLFGLLAGLVFAIASWGFDGYLLANANADLPWLKLFIGLPFCLVVGGLAGWLTAVFDNALVGFFLWLLAGLCYVFVQSHIPFEGVSTLVGYLEPQFRNLDIYPFVQSARMRMGLLYFVVGFLAGLFGAFEVFIVEAATRASFFGRWAILMVGALLIIPVSLGIDSLITQPLRQPVLAVNELIQNGRAAQKKPVSQDEALAMGLRALKPFGNLINQPYKLVLGYYDPESMLESTVFVDFGDQWGICSVIGNYPTFCQLSAERYANRFACSLQTGPDADCDFKVNAEARQRFEDFNKELQKPVTFGVLSQRGTAVWMLVTGSDGSKYQCLLRLAGGLEFNSCKPLELKPAIPIVVVTPYPIMTSTPTPSSITTGTQIASSDQEIPATPGPGLTPVSTAPAGLPASLSTAPRYTIELAIDYADHTFQGNTHLDYSNAEDVPLDRLYFRLLPNGKASYGDGSLMVTRVLLNGDEAKPQFSLNNTVLEVALPAPLESGGKAQLDLEFNGVVPVDFGGSQTPAGYGIYNYTDGVMSLSGWYPILAVYDQQGWNLDPVSPIGDSVYSDMAYYDVVVSSPVDLVIVSTGVEESRTVSGNLIHTRFESGPARDFYLAASPNYHKASQVVDGTKVNSYYLTGEDEAGDKALSVACAALRIYDQEFGRYLYPEFDVVEAPLRNALGVEYPGIVIIGASLYQTADHPAFEVTVAHEAAHQWWYNAVGNNVLDEPWLDEALATYSSSLYYESARGKPWVDGLVENWQTRYDNLRQEGKDDLVTQSVAHFESLNNPSIYGGIVYSKGALFFKALREKIGDQAFFNALRNYYQAYQFRVATGKDLLGIFEQAAGKSLEDFYQQWLYSKNRQ